MTAISASHRGSERRFGQFSNFVSKLVAAIREGRRMMVQYEELHRLPDSELARMGVRREYIAQFVSSGR